jgi:nitrite reductase/ring-hydroxylating ferredoxin subunit
MVLRKLGRAVQAGTRPSQAPSRPGGDVDDSELDFYVVGKTSDVGPGELKYVEVGPDFLAIVLVNFEGDFYALSDICTHEEASLSDGELQGDELECPLHGGAVEIKTGLPANFPIVVPATTYRTRVVGDEVQIGLPK